MEVFQSLQLFNFFRTLGAVFVFCICSQFSDAQTSVIDTQRFEQKGLSLTFLSPTTGLSPHLKKQLVDLYFVVYPTLIETYNPDALKSVKVVIDTAYDGVAYASSGVIVISQAWLLAKPGDIDVLTHELMHIVQAYPRRSGPGWLVEGIADYARYKYGIAHEASGWEMPELKPDHHYTSSYRISARFLHWLELHTHEGIVKKLDHSMRNQRYTPDLWEQWTGHSLDALWLQYTESPTL